MEALPQWTKLQYNSRISEYLTLQKRDQKNSKTQKGIYFSAKNKYFLIKMPAIRRCEQ